MNFLLDLLYPKKCTGCKKSDTYFCAGCISQILQKDLICPVCLEISMGGERHPLCGTSLSLDGLWSLGWYHGPLRDVIKQFKYKKVRDIAETLGNLIADYWLKYKPFIFQEIKKERKRWTAAPVPLHWFRGNERGFNQSADIAQILSKRFSLAYSEVLKRTRFTRPQVKLRGSQRRQNIKGAFEIFPNFTLSPSPFVLLIDDVWTTGSTLKECCKALKKAGAQKVWAITLAR